MKLGMKELILGEKITIKSYLCNLKDPVNTICMKMQRKIGTLAKKMRSRLLGKKSLKARRDLGGTLRSSIHKKSIFNRIFENLTRLRSSILAKIHNPKQFRNRSLVNNLSSWKNYKRVEHFVKIVLSKKVNFTVSMTIQATEEISF